MTLLRQNVVGNFAVLVKNYHGAQCALCAYGYAILIHANQELVLCHIQSLRRAYQHRNPVEIQTAPLPKTTLNSPRFHQPRLVFCHPIATENAHFSGLPPTKHHRENNLEPLPIIDLPRGKR